MEPPSKDLSLTLSFSGFGGKRSLTLPVAAPLRIAAALAVCYLCYAIGTWQGRLEALASRPQAPAAVAAAPASQPAAEPKTPETGTAAPGDPYGQEAAVITPLNVRDPSALVMGPGALSEPPAASPPPPSGKPAKPWRKKRDSGEGPKLIPDPGPHTGPDIRL